MKFRYSFTTEHRYSVSGVIRKFKLKSEYQMDRRWIHRRNFYDRSDSYA